MSLIAILLDSLLYLLSLSGYGRRPNFGRSRRALAIDRALLLGSWWELCLRFSWGLINTSIGYLMAHTYNLLGFVQATSRRGSCLALSGVSPRGAYSIGGYIFGGDDFRANWHDHLYVHEYGHYLQSLIWGLAFVPCIALPSLLSAAGLVTGGVAHCKRWFEVDASRRAAKYMLKRRLGLDLVSYTTRGKDSPYPNPRHQHDNALLYFPIRSHTLVIYDAVIPFTFSLLLFLLVFLFRG